MSSSSGRLEELPAGNDDWDTGQAWQTSVWCRGALSLGAVFLLLFLMACGLSGKEETLNKLAEVRSELQVFENQISASDTEAIAVLEESNARLRKVQHFIIEGEYNQALAALDFISSKLNVHLRPGGGSLSGSAAVLRPFGQVSVDSGDGRFRPLKGDEVLVVGMVLRTAVRSGLKFVPFSGSEVFVPAQTEVEVRTLDGGAKNLVLDLKTGELLVDKKNSSGTVAVQMQDCRFTLAKAAKIEMKDHPLGKTRYAAVHRGQVAWEDGGDQGKLAKFDGMLWLDGKRSLVHVPTAPAVDSPKQQETHYAVTPPGTAEVIFRWSSKSISPQYHLQVSGSRHFITRVFDDQQIRSGRLEVDLRPGVYYWRVRALSSDKLPGPFSKVTAFNVRRAKADSPQNKKRTVAKKVPKGPKISKLDIKVISTEVIVSGKTNPNAKVNVNGISAVMLDEGYFRAIVTFNSVGEHELKIIAANPITGGESITSRKVSIHF